MPGSACGRRPRARNLHALHGQGRVERYRWLGGDGSAAPIARLLGGALAARTDASGGAAAPSRARRASGEFGFGRIETRSNRPRLTVFSGTNRFPPSRLVRRNDGCCVEKPAVRPRPARGAQRQYDLCHEPHQRRAALSAGGGLRHESDTICDDSFPWGGGGPACPDGGFRCSPACAPASSRR